MKRPAFQAGDEQPDQPVKSLVHLQRQAKPATWWYSEGEIYSIDWDSGVLDWQAERMSTRFPQVLVHYLTADF